MKDFTVSFIGVGAPRTGTTWLYRCLQEHPSICMPFPKEVHFFSDFMAFTTTNSVMDWDWYRSKFDHCKDGVILGEFSPSYMYDEHAAKRIHDAFPNCKIIIQLRNPIDGILSYFMHGICTFNVQGTFEGFIEKNPYFKDIYKYDEQVKRYQELFPSDQILFCSYEELQEDPKKLLTKVHDFLGVQHMDPPSLHKSVNAYGQCRSQLFRNFLANAKACLDKFKFTQYLYKKVGLDTLALKLVLLNRRYDIPKKQMKPETREELATYYRESNQKVQQHTGMQTEHWNLY